jgi:hypothetical protein
LSVFSASFDWTSWDAGIELRLESPLKSFVLSQTRATNDLITDFKSAEGRTPGPFRNVLEDGSGQVTGAVMLDRELPYYGSYQSILPYSCSWKDEQKTNIGLLLLAVDMGKFIFERIGLARLTVVTLSTSRAAYLLL